MRRLLWLGLAFLVSCAPVTAPSPSPAVSGAADRTDPGGLGGLDRRPDATALQVRRWYTVPDGLQQERARVAVSMSGDAAPGQPRARLRSTRETVPLAFVAAPRVGDQWSASLGLEGVAPGEQTVEFLVRMKDGTDAVVATSTFMLSAAVYVVWTLDFEGDDAGDAEMANTAAIADAIGLPMTVMWNPRVWTTAQVSAARADAMLAWTKLRQAKGDEIALHLHMWTDYVRAAGIPPRTTPNWGGRSDGYDVPITAYTESETRALVEYGLRLMADRGLPRPTSFRAGALFADHATLRTVAALGFTADCSAAPAGPFGTLQLPWTLASGAQPYYPARDDANKAGDLPLLEAPTNAGNTFGHSATSIAGIVNANLRMIAPAGQPATARRALTVVSHPSTIDATERGAIEALFRAFDPFRYDRDAGPLRFVTLAQLAKAYRQ